MPYNGYKLPSPQEYRIKINAAAPEAEAAAKAARKMRMKIRRRQSKSLERNEIIDKHVEILRCHGHELRSLLGYLQYVNPGEQAERRLQRVSKMVYTERQAILRMRKRTL